MHVEDQGRGQEPDGQDGGNEDDQAGVQELGDGDDQADVQDGDGGDDTDVQDGGDDANVPDGDGDDDAYVQDGDDDSDVQKKKCIKCNQKFDSYYNLKKHKSKCELKVKRKGTSKKIF